ncbi:hypothetical protein PAECIP111893_01700 [Paenibacillus plantiphilus]|uniref:Heme-binding protein Shr-like Hb-interacting domain-containing protein n=1 Tax=Paenibacillus plantiphilus TaxID=2905650 RepID=A0ABM9C2J9_9BACL|nr:hemoblobin-interacting domain-containing protein [Paenibacillus plantiphilus]CAH1201701.1 hypothetical protein PAECIP111893_01700 [Paenibacillus plantiphilus]
MMKDWIGVTTKGKIRTRMISSLVALVLVLSILPISAMASVGTPVAVTGENNASSVKVGSNLQMIDDSELTVTWNVYDVVDGDQLTTQNYASIDSETGLLTGTEAGIVRVTATASDGGTGSTDITVIEQVGALSALLALQGGDMVTLGKTKFTGLSSSNTFWATSGQESAQQSIDVGTQAITLLNIYNINLSGNPFVPAAVGQTISVIEVNGAGVVVGFGTFTVSSNEQIGTNKPPVLLYNKTSVVINEFVDKYSGSLLQDPERYSMTYSNVVSSNSSIVQVSMPYYWNQEYMRLSGAQLGTATVSFEAADNTGDKIKYTVEVTVATSRAPYLDDSEIPFTNTEIGIGFEPNADWASHINEIEVNGQVVQSENYTITNEKEYSGEGNTYVRGEILFHTGVLLEGKNRILVKAEGYTFAEVEQDIYKPEDSYYIATIVDKTNGGITATTKLLVNTDTADMYDVYDEQGTAVFQLMNGDVPVSTVSYTINDLDYYATFRAYFNVAGASANDNYSVRAFLITGESPDNMGYNLATEITPDEYDVLCQQFDNWY